MAVHCLAILLGVDICSIYFVEVKMYPRHSWLAYSDYLVLYRRLTMFAALALWSLCATVRRGQRRLHPSNVVRRVDILHSAVHHLPAMLSDLPHSPPSLGNSCRNRRVGS